MFQEYKMKSPSDGGRYVNFKCLWLGLWLAFAQSAAAASDEGPISSRLDIPHAPTYVAGDSINLNWIFHNHADRPLAFMWEGCCRLNGRLDVEVEEGREFQKIPPGQALAHMFAKAAVIPPGEEQSFTTFLSDWVQLKESGTYRFIGHYVGVLPEQQPQVPEGVDLWRGETTTPPLQFTLLSVEDYLAQRTRRSQRRGLEVELKGPKVLSAFQESSLELGIGNMRAADVQLNWPTDMDLWILNPNGKRVPAGAALMHLKSDTIRIPAGESVARRIPFPIDVVEGESLGRYRVFVELKATAGQPRVPSEELELDWTLDKSRVERMVVEAAKGPPMAFRNPSLKLLRVYLQEVGGYLRNMKGNGLEDETKELLQQLQLAACLKPLAPTPGEVRLKTEIAADGKISFRDPAMAACLSGRGDVARQMDALLGVRRHLGWDVAVEVFPDPKLSLAELAKAVKPLHALNRRLSGPPRARVIRVGKNLPGAIVFSETLSPANLVIRFSGTAGEMSMAVARKLPDPENPQLVAMFRPEEMEGLGYEALVTPGALETLLNDQRRGTPRVLAISDPNLRWGEIASRLEPCLERGLPVNLVVQP